MNIWAVRIGAGTALVGLGTALAIVSPGQWGLGLLEIAPVAIAVGAIVSKVRSDRRAATGAADADADAEGRDGAPHA